MRHDPLLQSVVLLQHVCLRQIQVHAFFAPFLDCIGQKCTQFYGGHCVDVISIPAVCNHPVIIALKISVQTLEKTSTSVHYQNCTEKITSSVLFYMVEWYVLTMVDGNPVDIIQ